MAARAYDDEDPRRDDVYEDDVHDEDNYDDEAEDYGRGPAWIRESPFWAVSALLHMILFIVLVNIAVTEPVEEEDVEIRIRQIPEKRKEPEKINKRDVKRTLKLPNQKRVEKPVIERKIDEVTTEIPKGTDLDQKTNRDLLDDSLNDAIGFGRGSGAYGHRFGRGSLISEGGSAATDDAVRAALDWLMRHQSPDGGWKSHDYTNMCKEACKNRDAEKYGDGRGQADWDVGVTALAMLAFLGYGQTHQEGEPEYVEVMRKAVKYLKGVQTRSEEPGENGRYGDAEKEEWIYNHCIATMAMGELLAISQDEIGLKKSVTEAVRLCLHAQNPGYGWKYRVRGGENDTSVTGWMVLALKTAKLAKLDVTSEEYETAFEGALTWFDRATSSGTGRTGYHSPGDNGSSLPSSWFPDGYPYSKDPSCMTAVAVLCRIFAGQNRSHKDIKRGVNILIQEIPQWLPDEGERLSRINMYYWYYASYAMFQFGGRLWKKWNKAMQDALLPSQRVGPQTDEDGSWDPVGEWGRAGGRVYSTAVGAMTLEVYYRFVRTEEGMGL